MHTPFLLLYLWWSMLMAPFQTVRIPGPGGGGTSAPAENPWNNSNLGNGFTGLSSKAQHSGVSTNIISFTFAGGNLGYVCAFGRSTSAPTISSTNNSWTTAGTGTESLAPGRITCWYTANTVAGADSITITLTGGTDAEVVEISGTTTSSPYDQTSAHTNSGVTSFTSNTTATLSQASEVAIGILLNDNTSNAFTVTASGFITANSSSLDLYFVLAAKGLNSTTGLAFTGTVASSSYGVGVIDTFKGP